MTTAAQWLVTAASLTTQDKNDIAAAVLSAATATPIKAEATNTQAISDTVATDSRT